MHFSWHHVSRDLSPLTRPNPKARSAARQHPCPAYAWLQRLFFHICCTQNLSTPRGEWLRGKRQEIFSGVSLAMHKMQGNQTVGKKCFQLAFVGDSSTPPSRNSCGECQAAMLETRQVPASFNFNCFFHILSHRVLLCVCVCVRVRKPQQDKAPQSLQQQIRFILFIAIPSSRQSCRHSDAYLSLRSCESSPEMAPDYARGSAKYAHPRCLCVRQGTLAECGCATERRGCEGVCM